jgi:hypothetical protein
VNKYFTVFGWFCFISQKDYSEEFRDITKGRIKDTVPTGGIMLLTQKPVSDDLPVRRFQM